VPLKQSGLARGIARVLKRFRVPGASIALVERGAVAWSEAFGVCRGEGGSPIGAETVFAVASLSKPPFAHLVVRLCERGLLDLDTPLADLCPEPYDAYGLDAHAPDLKDITARQVLSHTSGLGNWQKEDIGRIGFPPGSRWHYSGEGYVHLQAVVEHLTGSSLEWLADAEVFRPLGMPSSGYLWQAGDDAPLRPRLRTCSFEGREYTRASAASSLHTTASDYARFVIDTLESAVGDALLVPQVKIDDSLGWGLGWGMSGDIVWHWGEMDYFSSVAVASRAERRGLVCLTNGDDGLAACAEILEDALGDKFAYPIRAVLERGW
jgi:CubicO group peptidase (beta-lactamase class C family)